MRALAVLIAVAALAAPSLAQAQRLPRRSPSEQQVDSINRSLQREQQLQRDQQQNQFETNQLRQELNRQQNFPTLTGPNSVGRICAPGQLRC